MAEESKEHAHGKRESFKLDGEPFAKVKAAVDKHRAAHQAVEDTHKEMWEVIGEFVPATDRQDVQHKLNTKFEEHGVYFVEEDHSCPGCGEDHGESPAVMALEDAPPFIKALLRGLRSGGARG